jgi:hypothetical protein
MSPDREVGWEGSDITSASTMNERLEFGRRKTSSNVALWVLGIGTKNSRPPHVFEVTAADAKRNAIG